MHRLRVSLHLELYNTPQSTPQLHQFIFFVSIFTLMLTLMLTLTRHLLHEFLIFNPTSPSRFTRPRHPVALFGTTVRRDHTLVLSRGDVIDGAEEMTFWAFDSRTLGVALQVRVDELDEAIEIFCRHLTDSLA
jgi:hypothetical protein